MICSPLTTKKTNPLEWALYGKSRTLSFHIVNLQEKSSSSIGPSKCGTEGYLSAHIHSGRACMSWSGPGLFLFYQSKAFVSKRPPMALRKWRNSKCSFFHMNTIDSAIRDWLMSLILREKMDCVLIKVQMPKKKKLGEICLPFGYRIIN